MWKQSISKTIISSVLLRSWTFGNKIGTISLIVLYVFVFELSNWCTFPSGFIINILFKGISTALYDIASYKKMK